MKRLGLAFIALASICRGAADCRAADVTFALIEDDAAHVDATMSQPLERALREAGGKAVLTETVTLPCYYSGADYRFRLPPPGAPADASSARAAVLETDSDVTLVYPPEPELVASLVRSAQDPSTYRSAFRQEVSTRSTVLSLAVNPQGETLVTALLDPEAGESAQWRSTAASVKRLVWEGRPVTVVTIGKVVGGIGRLAAALSAERKKGAPLLGVSRGTVFGWAQSELHGQAMADALEGLGLKYAGIGAWELKGGPVLETYRRRRPDGIQFLSANIVYSSAPATPYFPSYALVESGGLRIALTAVTSASAETYLAAAGLPGLKVADPYEALKGLIKTLRERADLVVLINDVNTDTLRLRRQVLGVDLVLAEGYAWHDHGTGERRASAEQTGRREYELPLWTMTSLHGALDLLDVSVASRGPLRDIALTERHVRLTPSFPGDPGFPDFDPENLGITVSTEPALIPSAARVGPREFWSLAALILAEDSGSEASVIQAVPLPVLVEGDVKEGVARVWLQTGEPAVTVRLSGSQLKDLLAQRARQDSREKLGLSSGDKVRLALGGLEPDDTIHGLPIDERSFYRVATTQLVADALDLGAQARPLGRGLDELVLSGLKRRAGSAAGLYRDWLEGRTTRRTGLWRVDFRDVGLNIRNTTVVRDDAFNVVPNSRIQGFNERLIGGVFKTDLEYLRGPLKWTNTVEAEYARSRIQPRAGPALTNTTSNRLMLLTMGTRRVGSLDAPWFAKSWGPSLGLQFDGEFEAAPGLRRKKIYSVFPGLEFYGGTVIKSLELAANIRRDQSREPANTQYGLRLRTVGAAAVGPRKAATLEGELTTNYFFLTKTDQPQDLRLESGLQLKLRVPVWKQLSIAPFLDLYAFGLKTRRLYGYSAMTGITVGFSRLWKPQFERF